MTAEIAILNKEAVALASDSAVTVRVESEEKVFSSANKLFALSKYHPVGIMVHGSAIFMEIPWETIIKTYRKKLKRKQFAKLGDYAADFIDFLDNGCFLFPDSVQEDYFESSIGGYFVYIRREIEKEIDSKIRANNKITEKEIKPILSGIIKRHYELWENADNIPSIPESYNEEIRKKFSSNISDAIRLVFEKLPISKRDSDKLRKIASNLFSRFPEGIHKEDFSGVVVAGFGEEDIFPSIEAFDLEGVANKRLKFRSIASSKVDFENLGAIVPFAQREMVDTFIQGVDPSYLYMQESYLKELMSQFAEMIVENLKGYKEPAKEKLQRNLKEVSTKILEDFDKRLFEYRQNHRYSKKMRSPGASSGVWISRGESKTGQTL